MYEASFGLKRRPFAATPDATCFLASGPIQAALDELVVCVEQGQGIAVLTAPAGTGKTLLCERLRFELDDRFETVFLRHASFLTRRALLQTVLCELNSTYNHPSEHELRLELLPAIRALQPKREALVLICDEAHQLNESLLEELRILADFAEAGRPLVRLVLVGQPSLEEKLTQPNLEAFNQRIRAQIHLNTFDHAESLDYIDYRLTWSGGRTDEVFTPEALDLIVRASDGVPRCINQLADHSLLLAFVAEQRPVSIDLVHEALNDLRQLPLHWNEPVQRSSFSNDLEMDEDDHPRPMAASSRLDDTLEFETPGTTETGAYVYEPENESSRDDSFEIAIPSSVVEELDSPPVPPVGRSAMEGDEWRKTIETFDPGKSVPQGSNLLKTESCEFQEIAPAVDASRFSRRIQFHDLLKDAYEAAGAAQGYDETNDDSNESADSGLDSIELLRQTLNASREVPAAGPISQEVVTSTNSYTVPLDHFFQEEMIVDRYTAIDAGLEPPNSAETNTPVPEEVHSSLLYNDFGASEAAGDTVEISVSPKSIQETESPDKVDQVATDVFSIADSMRPQGTLSSNSESLLEAIRQEIPSISRYSPPETSIQPPPVPESATWEAVETPIVESTEAHRPFRFLFSKLRRKQQGL